jgi:hypothetical protein
VPLLRRVRQRACCAFLLSVACEKCAMRHF